MLKQMSAQYIVTFVPQGAIKEKLQLIQDALSAYFPPASYSMIGMPVNAMVPAEIPRITAVSAFGHSSLYIAESDIRMRTTFDAHFNTDHARCWEYFKERMAQISVLAKRVSDDRVLFAGIVAQFFDEDVENPTAFVRDKYFTGEIGADVYDLAAHATYVREDRYYLNITVDNLRDDQDPGKEALGIKVDINSRYQIKPKALRYMEDADVEALQRLYVDFVENKLAGIANGR